MLDDKDKLILEYLMHNCRITTTKLAKLTGLSQPSIVYRIKRLEKENYISKYDIIIDLDKIPIDMYIFFLEIPNNFKTEFEKWCIANKNLMTLGLHVNKYNYSLTSMLKPKLLKELEEYLKKHKISYEKHKVYKNIYLSFSIFDLLPPSKIIQTNTKTIELDKIDGKIFDCITDGGAKYSIKEIAQKTNLSVDLVTYRFKKLKKHNYFRLIIAQPNTHKFHLNYSMLILKIKNLDMNEIAQRLQIINRTTLLGQLENNTYFATTIITDIENYKKTLQKIYEAFDRDLIDLNDMMIEDAIFLNRLNLEEML